MKIEIPIHNEPEWTKGSRTPEETISLLRERLQGSPPKTEEELDQVLAKKAAHSAKLHQLEIEAKLERAKRANERVKDAMARKLRVEAANVARAASKIERSTTHVSIQQLELAARRKEAAQRREMLFAAVREARAGRALREQSRQSALASSVARACTFREKRLQATADRSASQVKHAIAVANATKEARVAEKEAVTRQLSDRLEAAEARRQEGLSQKQRNGAAAVSFARSLVHRRSHDERIEAEQRQARLAFAIERALGQRAEVLEARTARAAQSNARAAEVVEHTKLQLAAAAESQAAYQLKRMQIALTNKEAARSATQAHLSTRRSHREAVAFDVMIAPATSTLRPHLVARLAFCPRMLCATAKYRHAAAACRRTSQRHFAQARGAHFGEMRVALAQGRRLAVCELKKAAAYAKHQVGSHRARVSLDARRARAMEHNARVDKARVRRSHERIAKLGRLLEKESRRIATHQRKAARLALHAKSRLSLTDAAACRRLSGAATKRALLLVLREREEAVATRRQRILSILVAKAKLSALGHRTPAIRMAPERVEVEDENVNLEGGGATASALDTMTTALDTAPGKDTAERDSTK